MNILHIGPDRSFTAFLVGLFERVAPGENSLLLQTTVHAVDATYDYENMPVEVVDETTPTEEQVARAQDADVIVVHGMSRLPSEIVAALDEGSRPLVVWSGWGYDYHREPWHIDHYFGPRTRAYVKRTVTRTQEDPEATERVARDDELRSLAAGRTDYFSAPAPTDLAVLQGEYPEFQGEYRQLNYGDMSVFAPDPSPATGHNILVGNSATPANNHAEAFVLLSKLDLGDRDVIVPLSYGDPNYTRFVIGSGEHFLGERFRPLTEFMPLEDYLDVLRSCSVAVFNHHRQQALGNVVSVLAQGTHLHLPKANPLRPWLRSIGVEVRSLASLRSDLPDKPMAAEELEATRRALAAQWGTDVVEANARDFVDELRSRAESSRASRLFRWARGSSRPD